MNYGKPTELEEEIGKEVANAAFNIHKALGPGF